MGRTATILLREHVDDGWLLELARAMAETPLHHPPCFPGDTTREAASPEPGWRRASRRVEEIFPVPTEDELDLFRDFNLRCPELGYFSHDEAERLSRRVDLRGPLDTDPGPLEMAEGGEDEPTVVLAFTTPASA